MRIKQQVEWVLANLPETRNSDIALTIALWKKYYPAYIKVATKESGGAEFGIYLSSLYTLPTQESIKRIRALIQNDEHKFLPTEEKIRRARRIKEEWYRQYINSQTEYKRI